MPYIKVSPSALISISETLRNNSSKVGRIEGDFASVARRLDWDVRSASDIQRRIDRIKSELDDQARMLKKMYSFVGNAKQKYASAQSNARISGVNGSKSSVGSSSILSANSDKKSWLDSLGDSFRSAIDSLKNGICAGVNAVSRNLNECKAYWVNNWNSKGWFYKTVKATGAVLSIVGSVAIAVSAIGAAIASGGAAAPVAVAVLLTLYNGNSVANSVADLCNIFGGDVNQVGQTNFLKSGLKLGFGKAGELVGYREAGEKVGEIVYTAGSVASTVLSLRQLVGKVIQTDSLELGNSVKSAASAIKGAWTQNAAATFEEAKIGISGLTHIATKVPLREVGLQVKLLTGHLSSLESTIQGMQLLSTMKQVSMISETVGTATKLIDTGVDVLNLSNEAWFSITHKGDASATPPARILKSDEAFGQIIESVTGISENDMAPINELDGVKPSKIREGVMTIQEIVDGIVEAKEAWNFVNRTSTQGG